MMNDLLFDIGAWPIYWVYLKEIAEGITGFDWD